jgi:electron transport complex protein RnfD
MSLIFKQDPLYMVLSGGLLFGAVFMATDYVTSPINWKGKLIFGIGCGLLTSLIRKFGYMPEGVSYAILLMNLLVPYINKITVPKPFGWEAAKK